MDESRVRESEMAEWHRLQGGALRPGPQRRKDLKSLEADVVRCRAKTQTSMRDETYKTLKHPHLSDLLRSSKVQVPQRQYCNGGWSVQRGAVKTCGFVT